MVNVKQYCTIKGCRKIPTKPGEKRNFHRLPCDISTRQKWIQFIEIANNKTCPKNPFVCSRHFSPCCIKQHGVRVRVKDGHCPSLQTSAFGCEREIFQNKCPCQEQGSNSSVVQTEVIPVLQILPTNESNSQTPTEVPLPPSPVSLAANNNDAKTDAVTAEQENHPDTKKLKILEEENEQLKKKLRLSQSMLKDAEKARDEKAETLRTVRRELYLTKSKLLTCQKQLENKILQYLQKEKDIDRLRETIPEIQGESEANRKEILSALIKRSNVQVNSKSSYEEILQEFAIQLHFYSPRAYEYLREAFGFALPHPTTLYRWLLPILTKPGFFPSSLQYLKDQCQKYEEKVYVGLIFDEVHLRKQKVFNGETYIGYTDYGGLFPEKTPKDEASAALFMMATGINKSFKLPLGYILTKGLPTNLLKEVIEKTIKAVHDAGAIVVTLTMDGLSTNCSTMEALGANLDPQSPSFQPFFKNPVTQDNIYVIFDPPHMIKLIRNMLGDLRSLVNDSDEYVKWSYLEKLNKKQEEEGLRYGNKLTIRHIEYKGQIMKVRYATQLFSESVATALEKLESQKFGEFKGAQATANFCRILNRLFDVLNSHCFGKYDKAPLRASNKENYMKIFSDARKLLYGLKSAKGESMLKSHRGTGPKGLLITMRSFELLMEEILAGKRPGLKYLTGYRVCQDHLEMFFSVIRARFGFNNNPNAGQLMACLKSILAVKLKPSLRGNCVSVEEVLAEVPPINFSKHPNVTSSSVTESAPRSTDKEMENLPPFKNLSLFVDNVVCYVAGYVGRKILKNCKCSYCAASLVSSEPVMSSRADCGLLFGKNNGGLFIASDDLIKCCKITESVIRVEQVQGVASMRKDAIVKLALRRLISSLVFSDLRSINEDDHTFKNDHVYSLMKNIVQHYATIRLHHIAKQETLLRNPVTIRNRNVKLIIFKGN